MLLKQSWHFWNPQKTDCWTYTDNHVGWVLPDSDTLHSQAALDIFKCLFLHGLVFKTDGSDTKHSHVIADSLKPHPMWLDLQFFWFIYRAATCNWPTRAEVTLTDSLPHLSSIFCLVFRRMWHHHTQSVLFMKNFWSTI